MIQERFASGLVLDGALATELESRGANLTDSLWSAKVLIESPELIQNVHLDYLHAGADVITTSSYQCSFDGLQKKGLGHQECVRILTQSVDLARAARDIFTTEKPQAENSKPLIAASIGSYGASLSDGSEYTGNFSLSAAALYDWHLPRFEVLAESGADLIAFETIPSLTEAQAIAKLLANHPQVLAWISFSANSTARIGSGEDFRQAVELFDSNPNLLAMGINCTSPGNISAVLKSLKEKPKKPFLVYPNSGENWNAKTRNWDPASGSSSLSLETQLGEWWNLGVRNFGGCCRTTPDTIRMISQFVRNPK